MWESCTKSARAEKGSGAEKPLDLHLFLGHFSTLLVILPSFFKRKLTKNTVYVNEKLEFWRKKMFLKRGDPHFELYMCLNEKPLLECLSNARKWHHYSGGGDLAAGGGGRKGEAWREG